jgi:hypothetical protein
MIPYKLYIFTYNGQILETFRTIPLAWDYLNRKKLNFEFTCTYFERRLEDNERFEFNSNTNPLVIKLDHPNSG